MSEISNRVRFWNNGNKCGTQKYAEPSHAHHLAQMCGQHFRILFYLPNFNSATVQRDLMCLNDFFTEIFVYIMRNVTNVHLYGMTLHWQTKQRRRLSKQNEIILLTFRASHRLISRLSITQYICDSMEAHLKWTRFARCHSTNKCFKPFLAIWTTSLMQQLLLIIKWNEIQKKRHAFLQYSLFLYWAYKRKRDTDCVRVEVHNYGKGFRYFSNLKFLIIHSGLVINSFLGLKNTRRIPASSQDACFSKDLKRICSNQPNFAK